MVRVHFTVTGVLSSFAEDVPSAMAADLDAIRQELNERIARLDIRVDGRHPQVQDVFFINQLPLTLNQGTVGRPNHEGVSP